jgi:hypothetical protein
VTNYDRLMKIMSYRGKPQKRQRKRFCAYCHKPAEGRYSVHRDGFCEGPQVPLCDACGSGNQPSLHQIWRRIAQNKKSAEQNENGLKA